MMEERRNLYMDEVEPHVEFRTYPREERRMKIHSDIGWYGVVKNDTGYNRRMAWKDGGNTVGVRYGRVY